MSSKPKLIGWLIIDNVDVPFKFVPKTQHFFGGIIENDAPNKEYVDILSRDWAGLAPFTVKEIYC